MKKLLKSILALTLATTLLLPSVKAQETEVNKQNPVLEKILTINENVLTPKTDFNFSLTPVNVDLTDDVEKVGDVIVKSGEVGLLSLESSSLEFGKDDDTEKVKTTTLKIKEDLSDVTPGIYRYEVKENEGNFDGITYDKKAYTVDLYVTRTESGKEAKFVAYNGEEKVNKLEFNNVYVTKNLKVKKVIEGNAADLSKKFTFTLTVTGQEGEKFNTSKENLVLQSGVEARVELGHNEEITIYGLSENDTYTVKEDSQEYTAEGEVLEATKLTEDKTITVTNRLNTEIPTGIIENIAPFALIMVAAVAFGFIYFRKKRHEA